MNPCINCGDASTTDHHTSYQPEQTVRVCHACHWRIHNVDGFRDDLEPEQARPENYETDEKDTVTARTPTGIVEDVDALADQFGESRSKVVVAALADYVGKHTEPGEGRDPEDVDQHLPTTEERRDVYLAALDGATERLRLHERHVGGVAQQLQNINKDGVKAVLQDLRREGYVSLMQFPPDCETENLSKTWRVKPPVVDPDEWTFAEHTKDERPDVLARYRERPPESTCLSHDFIAGRDDCLKCGAPKSEHCETVECDGCESVGFAPDLVDGYCSGCRMTAEPVRADGGEER